MQPEITINLTASKEEWIIIKELLGELLSSGDLEQDEVDAATTFISCIAENLGEE